MFEKEMDSAPHDREHRRFSRLKRKIAVDAALVTYPIDDDQYSRGKTDNISLGGLNMRMPNSFEEGSLLQIKIRLSGWQKYHPGFIKLMDDSDKTPLNAIAEVLRSEKDGNQYKIATRFINIDPEDYSAFQTYLDSKLSIKTAQPM